MKILSISTSSEICSVALLEDFNLIKEINKEDQKTHSENLMPMVQEVLESTHTSLSQIDLIVCDKGPGSFTGIRIGIATVKALSQVYNIPVVGISSLDALTYNISTDSYIASIIDARNNQVYCGIFNSNHELQNSYIADDINNILPTFSMYDQITFIGNGAILHKDLLKKLYKSNDLSVHKLSAYKLGLCGLEHFKNGDKQTADTLLPMYLRKSQAERIMELHGNSN